MTRHHRTATKQNNNNLSQKERAIETIIDIFVRVVGFIERDKVSKNTNPPKDFYIDTDDLSFYLEEVEKHFNVNIPQSEWFSIDGTIESVADLVLRHSPKQPVL